MNVQCVHLDECIYISESNFDMLEQYLVHLYVHTHQLQYDSQI